MVVYRMNSQYTVLMRIIIARRLFMVLTIIRSLSYVSNNWPEMAVFTEINGFSNRAMVFGFNPPAHKRCCRTFRSEPFLTPSHYLSGLFTTFFGDRYDFSVRLGVSFLGWIGILSEYTDCTQSVKWPVANSEHGSETKKDQSTLESIIQKISST